jgi:nucleotide-binding universal stress UspA family protein
MKASAIRARLYVRNQLEATMDDAPILICYDDSTGARHAIDAAAVLFADRRAVILDVAPPLTVAESYAALGAVTPDFERMNSEDALSRAHIGAKLARRAGLTAEARADIAAPTWDGVVEVADEIGAAAIVIGSRGLTGAREFLSGSLSHQVAERAGRPVLIVPPPHSAAKHRS